MGKKILSGIIVALLAAMLFSVLPTARAQTQVKIGWSMPLSGPASPTAYVHHLYYWMVIDDFNAKGGLNLPGVGTVHIVYEAMDDGYDTDTMLANYAYLVETWGADLLFAPWSTSHNVAAWSYFEANQYPLIALTAGSIEFQTLLKQEEDPWAFVCLGQPYEDSEQLVQLFQFINSKVPDALKIRKVGIAYRNDEHGQDHSRAIYENLTAVGIAVPVRYSYNPFGTINWAAVVAAFRSADVDVAIVCGYDEVAGFVHQCITEDYNPKLIFHGPALETSFLVYGPLGFTPGDMAGLMYYDGFPSCAYTTSPFKEWYLKHREYTRDFYGGPSGPFPHGYPPFPASTVFYLGPEALLRAAEKYGLNRPRIRQALEDEEFDLTLGMPATTPGLPIKFHFRKGISPTISQHGTTTQWQGKEMMDVIWPPEAKSTDFIIYPKWPWSWADTKTDFNRDGKVDLKDIIFVIGKFGTAYCMLEFQPWYDVAPKDSPDSKVDLKDIIVTIGDFGLSAPSGGIIKYS